MKRYVAITPLLFMASCASADVSIEKLQVNANSRQVNQSQAVHANELALAKAWGLNAIEWQDYQQYMKKEGHYLYPNANPLEVMALRAKSADKMRYYTDLWVQKNHELVTKELAFNVLYEQEMKRLYPNEKPLKPLDVKSFALTANKHQEKSLQAGDELILIANAHNIFSYQFTKTLISKVTDVSGTSLSIYLIAKPEEVNNWAREAGIDSRLISRGKVHLHVASKALIDKLQNTALPAAYLKRAGHLSKVSNL